MGNHIGVRKNGKVVLWPEEYADGAPFSIEADPAPTRAMLDEEHFLVLQPGQGTFLPFVTREAALEEIKEMKKAKKEAEDAEKAKAPPVAAPRRGQQATE